MTDLRPADGWGIAFISGLGWGIRRIRLQGHVSYAFARSLGGNHIDSAPHLCVGRMGRVRHADIAHSARIVVCCSLSRRVLH